MATIRSPIGCGVDSRDAWNKANTQLIKYNRDIKKGFNIWTSFNWSEFYDSLDKKRGASDRNLPTNTCWVHP